MTETDKQQIEYPYIVFKVDDVKFAMSSEYILSISMLADTFGVEKTGDVYRGMTEITGQVIRLLDMRVVLGRTSMRHIEEEFVATITKAKDAHIIWMDTLESSIKNHTEFSLATDPHQCAFGKWYDSFKTDNQYLKRALAKLASPHAKLHNSAKKIIKLSQEGHFDLVEQELEKTNVICHQQIIPLLDEVIAEYKDIEREMVLYLKKPSGEMGIMVDQIFCIGDLHDMSVDIAKGGVGSEYAKAVAKDENGDMVLLLDEDLLLTRYAIIEEKRA